MNKRAILSSLCASVLLLASVPMSAAEPAPKPAEKPAATNAPVSVFKDKKLEAAVRRQVFAKRESQDPLTAADVATVSTVALASLEIPGNQIIDLVPLAGLKQLQYLNLASNQVSVIAPLASVPALQYIELSHNRVKDVKPLSGLTNLASIYLSANRLGSVALLTNLPRVATLYIDHNKIRSIEGFLPQFNTALGRPQRYQRSGAVVRHPCSVFLAVVTQSHSRLGSPEPMDDPRSGEDPELCPVRSGLPRWQSAVQAVQGPARTTQGQGSADQSARPLIRGRPNRPALEVVDSIIQTDYVRTFGNPTLHPSGGRGWVPMLYGFSWDD